MVVADPEWGRHGRSCGFMTERGEGGGAGRTPAYRYALWWGGARGPVVDWAIPAGGTEAAGEPVSTGGANGATQAGGASAMTAPCSPAASSWAVAWWSASVWGAGAVVRAVAVTPKGALGVGAFVNVHCQNHAARARASDVSPTKNLSGRCAPCPEVEGHATTAMSTTYRNSGRYALPVTRLTADGPIGMCRVLR